jgi:AraC-like DNA-binding protein
MHPEGGHVAFRHFPPLRPCGGHVAMEYILSWRMALAKEMLRGRSAKLDEVAHLVGYSSASTFSIAFSRHLGLAPGRYARSG